jgi:hypothetical protein
MLFVLVAVLTSRGWCRELPPDAMTINTVAIRGVERVVQIISAYRTLGGLAELERAMRDDGLDEFVFLMPDSTLWLAYGKQIDLYTQSAHRVQTAYAGATPVKMLLVDDENRGTDYRAPVGRGMLILLVMAVLTGLSGGILVGLLARRNVNGLGIGRDPLVDRAFYGLIIGILAALLIYGLSDRKLDFRGLATHVSEKHLYRYMVSPPGRP